jgi:hypothetical protein
VKENDMNRLANGRLLVQVGMVAVLTCLCVGDAQPQNPSLKPTYGSVTLKSGFTPDPYVKQVVAGGPIQTKLGGVAAWVTNAPDFKLTYEAGDLPLTIHVESKADTTLLINLPDGSWVANDDHDGNRNPLLRFAKPQTGRYDIWVGTFGKDTAPAVLKITELK